MLICFPSFFWSVKNFALIAPPRHGLAAPQKPRVYCIESAPGRSEMQTPQLGRCRPSDDHRYSLGAKMGFCRPHEMQLHVLKQFGIRGADVNIVQAVVIGEELSMDTWREILCSPSSGLPTDLWGLRGSCQNIQLPLTGMLATGNGSGNSVLEELGAISGVKVCLLYHEAKIQFHLYLELTHSIQKALCCWFPSTHQR